MKTMIALPTLDSVKTEFMMSLIGLSGADAVCVESSSLVWKNRNNLVLKALEGDFTHIVWIDSDMVFGKELLKMLKDDAERGLDYVSALCFRRKLPTEPAIYKTLGWTDRTRYKVEPYRDYPRDTIFEVAGSGSAAMITSVDCLKAVMDEFHTAPFEPLPGFGEDLSLCVRLGKIGIPMYCDSRIKTGHIASYTITEQTYFSQLQAEALMRKAP